MEVVPLYAGLQVEVTHVEIDGRQHPLVMVVHKTVVTFAFLVDVDVVVTEDVRKVWTCETAWMESHFTFGHDAFAQT